MVKSNERESLAAKFERHAEEEGKILSEYRALSEKLAGGPAAFIIDMILTEEEMHHLLLVTTAKWLREPATWKGSGLPEGSIGEELLRRTQQLKKHEKETIDSCLSLRASLSGADEDVIGSVLEVMTLDSEKHHRLLSTVEKLIKG